MIHRKHIGVIGLVLLLGASAASAGYTTAGYTPQIVESQTGLANSALSYQTNGTWGSSGLGTLVTTNFTGSSCSSIDFSRLYLDIWGGTNSYTCTVTTTVNGVTLAPVTIGGTGDSNPTFNSSSTCVYGSGAGMWQVAYSGISSLLYTDGTANTVSFIVTDSNGTFDGRTACASLISVYSDPSINQTLDYYIAEGDGTIRRTPGTYGSPDERTVTFDNLNTSDVTSALYHAGYTHGTTGQQDQLYFNGTAIGGSSNDATTGSSSNYGPNNLTFDVTSILAQDSSVLYSVDTATLGATTDTYLRANIGVLEITHPVPEPATLAILAAGGVMLAIRRRERKC